MRADTPKKKPKDEADMHVREAIESIEQDEIDRLNTLLENELVDVNAYVFNKGRGREVERVSVCTGVFMCVRACL